MVWHSTLWKSEYGNVFQAFLLTIAVEEGNLVVLLGVFWRAQRSISTT